MSFKLFLDESNLINKKDLSADRIARLTVPCPLFKMSMTFKVSDGCGLVFFRSWYSIKLWTSILQQCKYRQNPYMG